MMKGVKDIMNELVQIYLPVTHIKRSVDWYIEVFGYERIWMEDNHANLKLKQGPLLFLKKTAIKQPIHFSMNGQRLPVLSFKTKDIDKLYNKLLENNENVQELSEYGKGINGPYKAFIVRDLDGHLLEVNNYPDLHLSQFRGY